MKFSALFAALVVATSSVSVLANPTATEPSKVVAAIKDCALATTDAGLQESKLESLGWRAVEVEMTDISPAQVPTVLGKDPAHPLIRVIFNEVGRSGCLVEGWLREEVEAASLDTLLTQEFGKSTLRNGMRHHYFQDSVAMVLGKEMLSHSDFRIIVTDKGAAQ